MDAGTAVPPALSNCLSPGNAALSRQEGALFLGKQLIAAQHPSQQCRMQLMTGSCLPAGCATGAAPGQRRWGQGIPDQGDQILDAVCFDCPQRSGLGLCCWPIPLKRRQREREEREKEKLCEAGLFSAPGALHLCPSFTAGGLRDGLWLSHFS